jgi:hypothetical protein
MVGVVSLVRLSVVVPAVPAPDVSLATARSSALGATVAVSTVTASAVDALLTLPAASRALKVSEWIPSVSAVEVMLNVPVVPAAPLTMVPVTVAVPRTVVPSVSYKVT